MPKHPRIFICGDFHIPYHDPVASGAAMKWAAKNGPWDVVVCGGDLIDCEAVSRFLKDPRKVASLQSEFDQGKAMLAQMAKLGKRLIFLEGNHCQRVAKYLLRNAPALSDLECLDVRQALGARAWEWLPYPHFVKIDNLVLLHGESYGATTDQKNIAKYGGFNVAQGHSHRLSQTFVRSLHGTHSAVQWGTLAHLEPHYTHFPNWAHGFVTSVDGHLRLHRICDGKVVT